MDRLASTRAPPIKKGFLSKQGRKGLVKNWKTRFVVLSAGKLSYYVSEIENFPYGEDLKGELNLVNTELVVDKTYENANQIYVVSFNGESGILLQTKSSEELAEWTKSLKEHIVFANKATTEKVYRASSLRVSPEDMAAFRNQNKKTEATASNRDSNASSEEPESPAATPQTKKPFAGSSSTTSDDKESDGDNRASLAGLVNRASDIILDGESRGKFLSESISTSQAVVTGLRDNFSAGKTGERGERLIGSAIVLLLLIITAPPYARFLDILLTLGATALIAVGISMVLNAIWELKENISFFLVPAEKGKLVKTGLYSLVRHPLYGGVILFSFGWSFLYLQPNKIVFTLLLAVVLDKAAEIEEDWLEKTYPKEYPVYANDKKALIPFVY